MDAASASKRKSARAALTSVPALRRPAVPPNTRTGTGHVSVSTTRVSTKERAAVVEWKLKETIGNIQQLMNMVYIRIAGGVSRRLKEH